MGCSLVAVMAVVVAEAASTTKTAAAAAACSACWLFAIANGLPMNLHLHPHRPSALSALRVSVDTCVVCTIFYALES